MHVPMLQDDRPLRRRWELLLLILAVFLSFACVFLSAWLALNLRSQRPLSASILAEGRADYGRGSGESPLFAPLSPGLGDEAATDIARLASTPNRRGDTAVGIVRLPPTPTVTATPTPSPTARPTSGAISVPSATARPSPTSLPTATRVPAFTPTPTRWATSTLVPTATPSTVPVPTQTPTWVPTSTQVPPTSTQVPTNTPAPQDPTSTNTPVPGPPTDTPTPTNTATPTNTPTPTDTPTPTSTPLPPQVLAVNPVQEDNDAAVNLVITGTNFVINPSASLIDGGETPLATTYISPTLLYAVVPAWFSADYYDLRVTNPDLQSDTLTNAFTLTNPIPAITGLTPDTGPDSSDALVTITGGNFVNGLSAWLDGFALLGVTVVDSTTLTATIPVASSLMPGGFYTLTVSNPGPLTPSNSLPQAFTVTVSYGDTPTCSGSANCDNAGGPPDGQPADVFQGGYLMFTLPPGSGISDGMGYDFVFFENPAGVGILLDWVVVEISEDGSSNWCEVFDWGNQNPPEPSPSDLDTNTNIEPPYGSDFDGEVDNEAIPSAALWPGPPDTGIAIDIGVCSPGSYRYVRFSCPNDGSGNDGAQVDAILRLN